ncbi:MAG: hypothetical protein H6633_01205 [Anaerolineales bacterium]|nr:hypothetical protein [Anaerolineales bacterium]
MVGVAQEVPARLVFPDGRAEYRDPEIDEATLTAIANATGGDYFRAVDAAALQTIFEQIGKDLSTP